MISHSIEIAKKSDLFDDIIVSTNSNEIAEVSITYGASVPFWRPEELADDFAMTWDVMAHAVKWLQENLEELLADC